MRLRVLAVLAAAVATAAPARAEVDMAEARLRSAFQQVKVGMTLEQVEQIDELGHCTNWTRQAPPTCGRLRYFHRIYSAEDAAGKTVTYDYGEGRRLIFRNGLLVVIDR